jgi:two-component system, NtrC family, sensor histidine kinase HydH
MRDTITQGDRQTEVPAGQSMQLSDPQKFTIISAVIVAAVIAATSIAASWFYRRVIIERELAAMHDVVRSFVREEEAEQSLSVRDLQHYTENTAKQHLQEGFGSLTSLPGFALVKVCDPNRTIVWSNATALIGTKQTDHPEAVDRAIATDTPAAFNPSRTDAAGNSLIEFYLPFRLDADSRVTGVVALYRSAGPVDAAIWRGIYLLWTVMGVGGVILYAALYRLFLAVHNSRHVISSRFAKLSGEHQRLIQIEKFSAMGQMVTEIAHQLNNPLVGVVNLAELAEREAGDQPRLKELLGEVRSAGERCREYVQRVLRLGQVTRSEKQRVDLGQLARETVVFFQQSLGGHPAVVVEAPAGPVTCEVDPVLIRDALFNLVHNATQADPHGPVVVSVTREERDGAARCCLAVSDRGCGIPPAAAAKLFTPFFTTRPGGTGLGLSIAQHVAILHGGGISAQNRPDGGARFTIWIPTIGAGA